ncbi:MAG: futalosine hydrolase, partial [Bacteroidota bacterium]
IKNDAFADVGVEENGEWMDLFDMNFIQKNTFPYTENKLENGWLKDYNPLKLPAVAAITVNEVTTRKERRDQYVKKYNPFLESMEGAALHYVCLMKGVPFVQLRTISNMVGERNKQKWQIKSAIEYLNDTLIKYLDILQ